MCLKNSGNLKLLEHNGFKHLVLKTKHINNLQHSRKIRTTDPIP